MSATAQAPPTPPHSPQPPTSGGQFRGTAALTRLSLRRDRIRMPLFLLVFFLQTAASYTATIDLYAQATSRAAAAELWNSTPSLVAMFGLIYDPDSVGALATIKLVGMYAAIIGVIMVFQTVRHTRRDEDTGWLELLSATSIGRLAPLAAALINAAVLSLGIGAASAAGLIAGGAPVPGSIAFGLGWASAGMVFAAAAAVIAQLTKMARPAVGIGASVVLIAYVLRAAGDLAAPNAAGGPPNPGVASWLSPIGWAQQIRPYAGDRFAVALLPLALTAVLVVAAFALRRNRDLGAGILPDRPGSSTSSLRSPTAVTWHLNRGMVLAWAVGAGSIGLVVGTMADSIEGFFTDPSLQEWIKLLGNQDTLRNAFLAAELSIMSVAVAGLGIAIVNHLSREEAGGRAELVLAGPTSRLDWLGSTTVVAFSAVAGLGVMLGLAVGVGAAITAGDWSLAGSLLVAGATKVPAAWVVVGLAVALYGLMPRLVPAVWGFLLVALMLAEFADLWGLPDWVAGLSPFRHSPPMPGGDIDPVALIGLLATAAALVAVGLVALRRRDLQE